MNTPNSNESESVAAEHRERQRRFVSHALVEVQRFRYLPLMRYSAVLLDMSLGGFKLEFTGEVKARVGQRYWLNIPLQPLGIVGPPRLFCLSECRWFDVERYRFGGVFVEASPQDQLLLEQIVSTLRERGQL